MTRLYRSDGMWWPYPRCPHCGEEDFDWAECGNVPPNANDGDEWTVRCGCGEEYEVTLSVEVSFQTRCQAYRPAESPAPDASDEER